MWCFNVNTAYQIAIYNDCIISVVSVLQINITEWTCRPSGLTLLTLLTQDPLPNIGQDVKRRICQRRDKNKVYFSLKPKNYEKIVLCLFKQMTLIKQMKNIYLLLNTELLVALYINAELKNILHLIVYFVLFCLTVCSV